MENYRATIVRIQKTVPATLYHYCPTGKLRYLLEPGADFLAIRVIGRNIGSVPDCCAITFEGKDPAIGRSGT